jgi:plasmid replication initiation protein
MNNHKHVGKGLGMGLKKPKHALDTHNCEGAELAMSNALVRAADRLNLTSKRFVWLCISRANLHKTFVLPGTALTVAVSVADYIEAFGVDPKNAYAEMKRCSRDLEEEKIVFRQKARRGKGIEEVRMRWVGRVTYNDGEGWVEVVFWHEVVPHLIRLTSEYTQIKLQQASALRCRYSWDLLRLFSQFKSTGVLNISLEEFHHAINAPESCIKDFGNLRLRCIEPAVKELCDKDGLKVDWVPKKMGRKVVSLQFRFKPDCQKRFDF